MFETPESSSADWGRILHAHGLRATEGRLATIAYLDRHPHSSVAETHRALAESHPTLSYQSVNNITRDLTRIGVLRRVDLPDSDSARFETRTGDNHHHVQCVVCQRIEDVDCVVGSAPCLTPNHNHGMRLLEAAVTFRGVCADCDATFSSETDERKVNV